MFLSHFLSIREARNYGVVIVGYNYAQYYKKNSCILNLYFYICSVRIGEVRICDELKMGCSNAPFLFDYICARFSCKVGDKKGMKR